MWMTLRIQYWVLTISLMLFLLIACGREATPEPTMTPSPTRTPFPTFTPTPDPADTPTALSATATPASVVAPTAPTLESTANVTAAADEATAPIDCTVEPNLDLAGYGNIVESMGCALAVATNELVGINEFGEGPDYNRFMLWFSAESAITVLQPDRTWQSFADTWQEGTDAEIMCNPLGGPETSPPLPRRGFGKLWCSDQGIQGTMGQIEREERLCQHAVTQEFEMGRILACFEDATIRYFRLLDDGMWDVKLVQ